MYIHAKYMYEARELRKRAHYSLGIEQSQSATLFSVTKVVWLGSPCCMYVHSYNDICALSIHCTRRDSLFFFVWLSFVFFVVQYLSLLLWRYGVFRRLSLLHWHGPRAARSWGGRRVLNVAKNTEISEARLRKDTTFEPLTSHVRARTCACA